MKHADTTRTRVDWDANVFWAEEETDPHKWTIAFMDYRNTEHYYDYTFTLTRDFSQDTGLAQLARLSKKQNVKHPEAIVRNGDWLDGGLDNWLPLDQFLDLYKDLLRPKDVRNIRKLPEFEDELLRAR